MKKLKKILLSLALIGISSVKSFAFEKIEPSGPIYNLFYKKIEKEDSRTLEDTLKVVDKRYSEIMKRNDILLENTSLENIAIKYPSINMGMGFSGIDYLDGDEEETGKKYGKRLAKDLFDETKDSLVWVDEAEEEIKDYLKGLSDGTVNKAKKEIPFLGGIIDSVDSLSRFGFSVKGKKANGFTYSPSINKQRREERRKRENRTGAEFIVPEFGEEYRFDLSHEYEFDGTTKKKIFGGFKTEARLTDFKFFNHKFNQANFEIKSSQEAEIGCTKLIGNNWYLRYYLDYDRFPKKIDKTGLVLVREIPRYDFKSGIGRDYTSRLVIAPWYDRETNNKGIVIDYMLKWR